MDITGSIKNRVTTKMLGDPGNPLPVTRDMRAILPPLIDHAGFAPFHRPAHTTHRLGQESAITEPWRFHVLDTSACRELLAELEGWPSKTGKILNMLAAADALLQVTWLPDPPETASSALFEPTEENMEHIAAASAAVQNFLTCATHAGLQTYWSSGGVLRSQALFEHLGIPANQILLGAVFVFPSHPDGEVEVLPGKQRGSRSPAASWSRWI